MRYNIKRLCNEIATHERDLEKLLAGRHPISKVFSKDKIDFEINSKRHAMALCKKLIGEEVQQRLNEGKSLDFEYEDIPLIKFASL